MRNVNLGRKRTDYYNYLLQHTINKPNTGKKLWNILEQEESDSENRLKQSETNNSTVRKLQQIEDKYYYSLDLNYYHE